MMIKTYQKNNRNIFEINKIKLTKVLNPAAFFVFLMD